MNRKKAERLIAVDIKKLSPEKMQQYKAQLIDAFLYARGEYGTNNDFFAYVPELGANVPVNYWLLQNIKNKLTELGL